MNELENYIDKTSSIPLNYQVKEVIKRKIKNGDWQSDKKIPNEMNLMDFFDVSRSTVRQAILELVSEGLLYRKKGVGTFVKKTQYEADFMTFSYPEELGKKHVLIDTEVRVASPYDQRTLRLNKNSKVVEITRLRYFKDDPAIVERSYLPHTLFSDILNKDMENPIYDMIIEDYSINIARHKVYIEPIVLDEYDANILGVEPNQPAIKTTKICESTEGVPVLIAVSVYRKDKCKILFQYEGT